MRKFSDLIDDIIRNKNIESGEEIVKSVHERYDYNISTEHFCIKTDMQAKFYAKEKGSYDLVSIPDILSMSDLEIKYSIEVLVKIFKNYFKNINSKSKILIVGLGNRHISADSLGTKVVSKVKVTFPELKLPHVMAVCPSVLGLTGIETRNIIDGVVGVVKPTHIVLIDSLCASNAKRLGRSIQITNTGICPGSGIGNNRKCIDTSICKNVISIGVPLLIYAKTFVGGLMDDKNITISEINNIMQKLRKEDSHDVFLNFLKCVKQVLKDDLGDIVVSLKDIEEWGDILSKIISDAINISLGVKGIKEIKLT